MHGVCASGLLKKPASLIKVHRSVYIACRIALDCINVACGNLR